MEPLPVEMLPMADQEELLASEMASACDGLARALVKAVAESAPSVDPRAPDMSEKR